MRSSNQFLRIKIGGTEFLLPGGVSLTIEQWDQMQPAAADEIASGWKQERGQRWPAYGVDEDLQLVRRDDWQRAVFLDAKPTPVGLIVDDAQMVTREALRTENFTPLGAPPSAYGALFHGAWLPPSRIPVFVFEAAALVGYLQTLGART